MDTKAKKVTISEKFSMVATILEEQGHEDLVEFILNEKAKVDKKNSHKSSKSKKAKGLSAEQKARIEGFIALIKGRTVETGITLNEIQKSLDITQGQLSHIVKCVDGLGKKVSKGRTHYFEDGTLQIKPELLPTEETTEVKE